MRPDHVTSSLRAGSWRVSSTGQMERKIPARASRCLCGMYVRVRRRVGSWARARIGHNKTRPPPFMGWRGPCSACCTGLASYLTRPAPRADRQGQTPVIATGFPVTPTSPGIPPGWCPFPTVKVFLLPPPDAAQAFGGQYLRVFHYPQNSSGYPRLIAVIHHRVHNLSTDQGGPAGRGNQRPVPQRFLPPRRLHCRMSDELFVPESFAVPDGLEAGEFRLAPLGRADFRAGAGVPAREPGDQREPRIAGPRRPP